MPRFKLVRPGHVEWSVGEGANRKDVILPVGAVFDSVSELDLRLNSQTGSLKFERVLETTPVTHVNPNFAAPASAAAPVVDRIEEEGEAVEPEAPPVDAPEAPMVDEPADDFDECTIAQLRAYAKETDIDLGDAKKKAEIINVLRSSLATA